MVTTKILVTHTETNEHYLQILKSCSGPTKMCKSIKNGIRKFLRKQDFHYAYRRKNKNNVGCTLIFRGRCN